MSADVTKLLAELEDARADRARIEQADRYGKFLALAGLALMIFAMAGSALILDPLGFLIFPAIFAMAGGAALWRYANYQEKGTEYNSTSSLHSHPVVQPSRRMIARDAVRRAEAAYNATLPKP